MMNSIYEVTDGSQKHNSLYSDYKAEVFAINLLKYYKEIDQVFLKRLGNNDRAFNKDIESVTSQVYELGELIVSITSHREGIYDYLPEGLFHPPSLGNQSGRIEDIIYQIQKQRKIESNTRDFFRPFELESFFVELNALLKENEFEVTDGSDLLLNTLKGLWPLLGDLDQDTAKIFVNLLPFFHSVRADRVWFEKCLTAFLQVPVKISFVPNNVTDIKGASDTVSLSNFHLGISMVLTGEHMDGERNWVIHYGPIPYNEVGKYIPNSALRKLLKVLYDYFLPATVDVEEHFVLNKTEQSFLLDRQQDTSRLGYSTFL